MAQGGFAQLPGGRAEGWVWERRLGVGRAAPHRAGPGCLAGPSPTREHHRLWGGFSSSGVLVGPSHQRSVCRVWAPPWASRGAGAGTRPSTARLGGSLPQLCCGWGLERMIWPHSSACTHTGRAGHPALALSSEDQSLGGGLAASHHAGRGCCADFLPVTQAHSAVLSLPHPAPRPSCPQGP